MMNQSNAALLQRAYNAIETGDGAAFLETLDENVIWHENTKGLEGEYRGREEVGGLFGRMMQELDGPISMQVHDILASDDHGVVLHVTTFSRKGRKATLQYADVYHLNSGKITEHWHLAVDPHADDEFWG